MSRQIEELRKRALGLLARREHSQQELVRKLAARGFNTEDVTRVVAELRQDGSLSDQRFTDSYIYTRMLRGYGPVRIRQELRERGIDDSMSAPVLAEAGGDWMTRLAEVRAKKFGPTLPVEPGERLRQSRFLQYRGFSADQIQRLFEQKR